MLPPFGEKGYSPNENARFLVITKTIWQQRNENAGFPVTTKLHAEEEGHPANEHAGFQSQQNYMFPEHDTMLKKHYLFVIEFDTSQLIEQLFDVSCRF